MRLRVAGKNFEGWISWEVGKVTEQQLVSFFSKKPIPEFSLPAEKVHLGILSPEPELLFPRMSPLVLIQIVGGLKCFFEILRGKGVVPVPEGTLHRHRDPVGGFTWIGQGEDVTAGILSHLGKREF